MSALLLSHVAISLIGIGAGFVVIYGMFAAKRMETWTALFLATTVATSLTGVVLPADRFMASHAFAILSIVALGLAIYARYAAHLRGGWRNTYVATALFAQYLNVFVLVVQSFLKIPALKQLAPTQTEPVFAVTQLVVLVGFVVAGFLAARRFRGVAIDADSSVNGPAVSNLA